MISKRKGGWMDIDGMLRSGYDTYLGLTIGMSLSKGVGVNCYVVDASCLWKRG